MKLVTKASVIFDRFLDALTYALTALFVLIWLVVCFNIISRYLGHPQNWALEVSEYSLVAICFLCAAWLLREEGHIVIDIVIGRLKPSHQALLNGIVSVIGAVACLILTYYGTLATLEAFTLNIRQYSPLSPPKYPLLAMVPAGGLLLFIQFLRRSYRFIRSWSEPSL